MKTEITTSVTDVTQGDTFAVSADTTHQRDGTHHAGDMSATETGKKYELAKTSLQFQAKEYFQNSTLHGVRYIAEKGRPFFDKFLWWCCTSIGATVTLIIIVSLWEKFQTNPTITGLDTDFHNWDVPFPGISICQEDPVNMDKVDALIEQDYSHIKNKEELRKYLALVGSLGHVKMSEIAKYLTYPTFPQQNLHEIAKKVVNSCNETLDQCVIKEAEEDCCKMFFPIFTENGFCYSFNIDPSQGVFSLDNIPVPKFNQLFIYETDSKWDLTLYVKDASTNRAGIYIHSANEQPGLDLEAQHMYDLRVQKISFSAKTTYTTEDANQLSIKQRHCVFPKEIKLITDDTYSYGACMRQCRILASYKKCKCVPFFYNMVEGYPYCDLQGLDCISRFKNEILTKGVCKCELGCENTVYEVEKLAEAEKIGETGGQKPNIKDHLLEIVFVSWPMIRYKREVLFGWVDLLVSFGGIAGLFLGFSLLSGVEIIYYFTMRACCMVVREKETLEKLRREYELEEKPPLDLSLTPSFMKKKENEVTPATLHFVQPN